MGLRDQFEKLRNYFIEDDDYEDEDYESELAEDSSYHEPVAQVKPPVAAPVRTQAQATSQPQSSQSRATSYQTRSYSTSSVKRTVGSNSGMHSAYVSPARPSNPVTTPQQTASVSNTAVATSSKIMMTTPHVYQDIMEMGNLLKSGTTVIVNFKNMADQQARRSIDFLTGVAYILDGDIQNIGGQSFLITPTGVSVDGAKESLLASGGQGFENFDLTSY